MTTATSSDLIKLVSKINKNITASIMVDGGSTGNFISTTFVEQHHLPTQALKPPRIVHSYDGTERLCDKQSIVRVDVGQHYSESLSLPVIPLAYDIIFGLPWLRRHNPLIDWRTGSVTLDSQLLPVEQQSTSCSTIELVSAINPRTTSLLAEFKDVFPDDLPSGLPPRRDIDRRIEMVPDSAPPSRPTYRMSI